MSDTVQLPDYAQRKPLSTIDPAILPEGFKPISLVLPALSLCWLFGEDQVHARLTGLPGGKSYVDMLFATAAMWGDFREADATGRAAILCRAFYLHNTRPNGQTGTTSYLLGVGWNAERAELWAPADTPSPLRVFLPGLGFQQPLTAARLLAYLCGECADVDADPNTGRVFDAHKLTQGWSPLRHERTVGIARNVEVLWTASHDRREPGWVGLDWEERLLTRALTAKPPRLEPAECVERYNSTIGPTWWHRGPIEPAAPSEGPTSDPIGPAQAAILEADLTSLEDDIHDLCDRLGVAVEDDGMIARERLRALAEVLTSANSSDPQTALYELAVSLLGLFAALGVPVSDSDPPVGLTLQQRAHCAARAVGALRDDLTAMRETLRMAMEAPSADQAPAQPVPPSTWMNVQDLGAWLDLARAEGASEAREWAAGEQAALSANLDEAQREIHRLREEVARVTSGAAAMAANIEAQAERARRALAMQSRLEDTIVEVMDQMPNLSNVAFSALDAEKVHVLTTRIAQLLSIHRGVDPL